MRAGDKRNPARRSPAFQSFTMTESLEQANTQQEKVSRFYYFSPILYYSERSLYSHTNSYNNVSTQCHVDGAQTAWATCASTAEEIIL